jgi:hypothetical protein
MLMLASTFYISPEGWLVLAFVFVVLPVSLISLRSCFKTSMNLVFLAAPRDTEVNAWRC